MFLMQQGKPNNDKETKPNKPLASEGIKSAVQHCSTLRGVIDLNSSNVTRRQTNTRNPDKQITKAYAQNATERFTTLQ